MNRFLVLLVGVFLSISSFAVEYMDWWKVKDSSGTKYTISFLLDQPLGKPVGGALDSGDWPKIAAIRVRNEQGAVIPEKFPLIVRAQVAALAIENGHDVIGIIPDQFIGHVFLKPSGDMFYVPKAQSSQVDGDLFQGFILNGYTSVGEDAILSYFDDFNVLDGLRAVGERMVNGAPFYYGE